MKRNSRTPTPGPRPTLIGFGSTGLIALLLALLMLVAPMGMIASAGHQDEDRTEETESASDEGDQPDRSDEECRQSGYNMQCNEFGTIRMENTKDVKGEHVESTTYITLDTDFEEENARWVMFSLRNTTPGGSPVEIQVDAFETNQSGDIITTRQIQDDPNEVELWVDTLDLPVDEEIRLEATVAVTELGAYQLETIVIPFDRAYDPIQTSGGERITLFSYTMLGVNDPTPSLDADHENGGWLSTAQETPAPGIAIAAMLLGAAALTKRRFQR